jgi:hypothetical protein
VIIGLPENRGCWKMIKQYFQMMDLMSFASMLDLTKENVVYDDHDEKKYDDQKKVDPIDFN